MPGVASAEHTALRILDVLRGGSGNHVPGIQAIELTLEQILDALRGSVIVPGGGGGGLPADFLATTTPIVVSVDASGAVGSGTHAARDDHQHGGPVKGEVFMLDAQDATERSTSTGGAVDLVSLTGLNIPALTPFIVEALIKKGNGAAAAPTLGLKINGGQVFANTPAFSAVDRIEEGRVRFEIGPRLTGYLESHLFTAYSGPRSATTLTTDLRSRGSTAMPTAAVTSITITGSSASASIALFVHRTRLWLPPAVVR